MTGPDAPDGRTERLRAQLDAVADHSAHDAEARRVAGDPEWERLQHRLTADRRRRRRVRFGLVSAAAACALVAAGFGWSQLDGRGPSVRVVPAAPEDPAATAAARAAVAGRCPAVTDLPPVSVDEGQRLSEGLTLEQATRRAQDEQQASVLDAWVRCALPDAYGQLRVEQQPQWHVVVALTDAAGPDPLAGAPLGVLTGRVEVETTPFSAVQMQLLFGRVERALQGCGLGPTSASIGLSTLSLGAGDGTRGSPGVAAVEACLDDADLGRGPGRDQVEVTDGSDAPA